MGHGKAYSMDFYMCLLALICIRYLFIGFDLGMKKEYRAMGLEHETIENEFVFNKLWRKLSRSLPRRDARSVKKFGLSQTSIHGVDNSPRQRYLGALATHYRGICKSPELESNVD